ncbi:MAG: hypothetical protein QF815_00060, partial [Candidatus Peribacteraceae bacterium]|nr:hypothetical protein [Candidatus Peribacteraceae bacterium]
MTKWFPHRGIDVLASFREENPCYPQRQVQRAATTDKAGGRILGFYCDGDFYERPDFPKPPKDFKWELSREEKKASVVSRQPPHDAQAAPADVDTAAPPTTDPVSGLPANALIGPPTSMSAKRKSDFVVVPVDRGTVELKRRQSVKPTRPQTPTCPSDVETQNNTNTPSANQACLAASTDSPLHITSAMCFECLRKANMTAQREDNDGRLPCSICTTVPMGIYHVLGALPTAESVSRSPEQDSLPKQTPDCLEGQEVSVDKSGTASLPPAALAAESAEKRRRVMSTRGIGDSARAARIEQGMHIFGASKADELREQLRRGKEMQLAKAADLQCSDAKSSSSSSNQASVVGPDEHDHAAHAMHGHAALPLLEDLSPMVHLRFCLEEIQEPG